MDAAARARGKGVQAAALQLVPARAAQPVAARLRGLVHVLPVARRARRAPVHHHELQLGGPGLGVRRGWYGGHAPLASAGCRPAGGPLHGHLPPPLQPAVRVATRLPASPVYHQSQSVVLCMQTSRHPCRLPPHQAHSVNAGKLCLQPTPRCGSPLMLEGQPCWLSFAENICQTLQQILSQKARHDSMHIASNAP